jgi:hypothetical protein
MNDYDAVIQLCGDEINDPARFSSPAAASTILFDLREVVYLRPEALAGLQRINTHARVTLRLLPDSQPHLLFTRLGLLCKPESDAGEGIFSLRPEFRQRAVH